MRTLVALLPVIIMGACIAFGVSILLRDICDDIRTRRAWKRHERKDK